MNKPTTLEHDPENVERRWLPRLVRASSAELPPFRLTGRDIEVIQAVYLYRALTAAQIQTLLFPTANGQANSRCRYRLQMLYQTGYLRREELPARPSEGRRPLVYCLDRKGARLLAQRAATEVEQLDWNPRQKLPGPFFLEHLLATNEVRIALVLATRARGWQITRWLDDKALKSDQMKDYVTLSGPRGGRQRAAVVPDGYFVLDTGQYVYHHFLEMDLGTVTGEASLWGKRDWARKVAAYLAYDRSGGYQARYHAQSWRVLTVTTSATRLQHLKAAAEKTGGKLRFWFTTYAQVTMESVLTEPIWQEAGQSGLRPLTW
jgi:hypothetical protein